MPTWALIAGLVVVAAGIILGGELLRKPRPEQKLNVVQPESRDAIVMTPTAVADIEPPRPAATTQQQRAPAPAPRAATGKRRSTLLFSNTPAPPCGMCGGSGTVTCAACGGELKVRASVECPECVHGMFRCRACYGTGKRECRNCGGDGKVRKQSGWRRGNGLKTPIFKIVACPDCSRGKVECDPCGGTGSLRCPKCTGTGFVERIQPCTACANGVQPCPQCQ
ncbi:MAG: hypothetical protein KDA32_13335 [Phycisphaerales bacterium]|nr:hypothetical protein [Phycisphaerales bacterium]